jgi:hypothetical protein
MIKTELHLMLARAEHFTRRRHAAADAAKNVELHLMLARAEHFTNTNDTRALEGSVRDLLSALEGLNRL